ncbi:MAG TPA: sigma-70 family RNA polymerase sigma factor [Mycobacteriales bacterium]|nr:sigma-70 family RNA polymerase sigma factor [Mycobacteriales bacterium]
MPPVRGRARAVASTREEDFKGFYALEYPALARYCYKLVADRELAHDLAQEAFTRMVGRLSRVDEPRAYLYGVATNLCRGVWKKRAQDSVTLGRLALEPAGEVASPDGAVVLRAAVDAMPSRLRAVLLLHYYADLSVADVAAAVGRPTGTVKRQLSEARALLAALLGVKGD